MFYIDNSGQMTLFEEKLRKNKFTKKEGGGGCEKEEGGGGGRGEEEGGGGGCEKEEEGGGGCEKEEEGGGGCEKEEGGGGGAEVEAMDPVERQGLDEREENVVLGPAEDDVELPECDQKMEPKSLSKGKSDCI